MSPRYSAVRHDEIDYGFWLIFDADGGMRFSRGEPSLRRGERAMACSAKLPRSLFSIPVLRATIGVDAADPGAFTIDVAAASEALKHAVGVDIDLRVSGPEGEP